MAMDPTVGRSLTDCTPDFFVAVICGSRDEDPSQCSRSGQLPLQNQWGDSDSRSDHIGNGRIRLLTTRMRGYGRDQVS